MQATSGFCFCFLFLSLLFPPSKLLILFFFPLLYTLFWSRCIFFASNLPHWPWETGNRNVYNPSTFTISPLHVDTPEFRKSLQRYYAEVSALDAQVGAVHQLLQQQDMEQNTLMIFTSEQGAALPACKWSTWECGINVAFIARWPGVIEPGSVSNAMIHYVDVVPTLIEISGGDPETISALEGSSFAKVLTGEVDTHNQFIYALQSDKNEFGGYNIRAIREGDWKYIWNLNNAKWYINRVTQPGPEQASFLSWEDAAARNPGGQASRLVRRFRCRPPEELYNLASDPYELENLARDPTQSQAAIILRLKTELRRWMATQGDPVEEIVAGNTRNGHCMKLKEYVVKTDWGAY